MNDNVVTALFHLDAADEPLTTTEVAKLVFDPEGTDELRNADRKVRHYIEQYSHLVREVERDDGTKLYTAERGKVHFGIGKVDVLTPDGDEVTVGLGNVMVHLDDDRVPRVSSIEMDTNGGGDGENAEGFGSQAPKSH